MPSPGHAQESHAWRDRPREKVGRCELPGSPATPQSPEEKEEKGSGGFTWAKDKLASALPLEMHCSPSSRGSGWWDPSGRAKGVIAAIIFFFKCFHIYCNLGFLLKTSVPEATEQRENTPPKPQAAQWLG